MLLLTSARAFVQSAASVLTLTAPSQFALTSARVTHLPTLARAFAKFAASAQTANAQKQFALKSAKVTNLQ